MPKIGTLTLRNRFLLAPMLEPNDIAFRLLCKEAGAALTYTGMTHTFSKQKICFDDAPAVQLFGQSPKGIAEYIKKYDPYVSLWDFNLGCPSKLSCKLAHGAFMHRDFENIEAILKTMRKATKKPISIKLRKSPQAIEIARLANKYCNAIAIHPRTSSQGYSGKADYSFALELKRAVTIPVIYSGDVTEENAHSILKDFDFVFIGRKAMGNPGIFSRLLKKKSNISFKEYLLLAGKYHLPFRQIKFQAMQFTKHMDHARKIRRDLIKTKTIDEIRPIMGIHENT